MKLTLKKALLGLAIVTMTACSGAAGAPGPTTTTTVDPAVVAYCSEVTAVKADIGSYTADGSSNGNLNQDAQALLTQGNIIGGFWDTFATQFVNAAGGGDLVGMAQPLSGLEELCPAS